MDRVRMDTASSPETAGFAPGEAPALQSLNEFGPFQTCSFNLRLR